MRLCFVFLMVWSTCLGSNLNTWKMNVPRVLLPLTEEGATFKLFSKGGCFTWKSSRPEIIAITPIPEGSGDAPASLDPSLREPVKCSASALVSISGKLSYMNKTQAVVLAEDFHSPGRILRTDVIADSISSLQILTKTHELYLEEAPEEFSVRAYDEHGNEFSSLDGIVFKWIIQEKQTGNVRFIKFRDSSYSLDPVLEEIEAKGLQGSKVLLEGIKTGSAEVSVRLASKAPYALAVPPAEVNVLVVANLFLVPPVAFVMPGGVVTYHAEQIKSNKIHLIDLTSSPQYYLEAKNTDLVTVDVDNVRAGSNLDWTLIFLRDKNVDRRTDLGETELKSPSADIHIVDPDHISIEIDPHKSWIVLVGNQYDLSVDLFDAENRKMFPSSNLVVKLEFQQDGYFDVIQSTGNGTWITGKPLKSGTVQIRATLIGTRSGSGSISALPVPLTATAVMEIFDQIDLQPKLSIFPWDPTARTMHQVMYTVTGGAVTSSFIWSSSNTSLSTVTQNGIAKTRGHLIGETTVTASMSRATQNFGTAIIRVAPAIELDIIDDHVREVEVGKKLNVPVAFFASDNNAFSDCAGFPYEFKLIDQRTFSIASKGPLVPQESTNSACTSVGIVASDVGFTNVKATYTYASIEDPGKEVVLADEATIGAFKPLAPIHPSSASALLAVGSTYHIVWSGGPQPWIKDPRNHFHKLEVEGENKNAVGLSSRLQQSALHPSGNLFAFEVSCQKLGSVDLVLTVGNLKSETLPRPVLARSKVSIKCGEPDKIKLEAEVPQPSPSACPLMAKTTGRVAALAYEALPIAVSVFDASGQKFDNISTFDISWSASHTDLASIPPKGLISASGSADDVTSGQESRPHQILQTNGKPGQLDVTANLRNSGSYLIGGFGSISDTISVNLVNDATISPEQLVIFNHPDNVQSLSIQGGSGFFDVLTLSGDKIIDHKYHVNNQSVAVTPSVVGETVLSVKDLCLVSKRPAPTSKIHVSGIQSVELLMVDKVQLGKSVVAQVRLVDEQGHGVPHEQLKFLEVKLVPASKPVVKLEPKSDSPAEDLLFVVHGSSLGLTMVTAEVTYGHKRISSTPMPIQVFPPLTLEPRNITLIIGAKFQVQVLGGPQQQQDSTVEFLMGNTKIAISNSVGLITASALGSTKLVGRVYGTDRTTSKRVVFSEDSVLVHVVKLDGIKIRAPVHLLLTGTEMPLQAVGVDGANQNAFSFGSARPPLHFHWSVSNQEVGDVVSVFHRSGVTNVNTGVTRFVAKKPGRVVLKLRVAITSSLDAGNQFQLDRDREFQDEIEIKVLESLALRAPHFPKNVILMSPNSEFQLKTNRDFAPGSIVTFSMVNSCNKSVVDVDKNGLVVAGQETGTCVVSVAVVEGEHSGVVQNSSVVIDVKPIKFAMINVLPAFKPTSASKPPSSLPKGATLDMELSYHDNLAAKFDAVHQAGAVSFRPSRFESNQISQSNDSSSIELVKVTETVLRATHVGGLNDFVVFDVRTAITPNVKKVTTGDVIFLQSSVTSEKSSGGWISEPAGIISMESLAGSANHGYGVAIRSGQARLSLILGQNRRTTLDLEVEAASKISFNKSKLGTQFHLTNSQSQLIFVNILSASATNGETSNFQGNFHPSQDWSKDSKFDDFIPTDLIECKASFLTPRPDSLFQVKAGFVPSVGSYVCRVDPISAEKVSAFFVSGEVELFVRPGGALANHNAIQGDSITLPFFSAFKVKTPEAEVGIWNGGAVVLQGLRPVLETATARLSHPDLFSVGRSVISTSEEDVSGVDRLSIPIYLKSEFQKSKKLNTQTEFFVEIVASKTLQSVKIPINIFAEDEAPDRSWSSVLGFALGHYETIMVAIICVFVTWIYAVKKSSTASATVANGSAKTTTVGPTSPFLNRTSNVMTAPATPNLTNADNRPYLWTVDNSPIYGSPNNGRQDPNFLLGNSRRSPRPLAQYSYTPS